MANTTWPVAGVEGVDLTTTYAAISLTTAPEYPALPFTTGTRFVATDGSEWMFGTAGGTIALYDTVWINCTSAGLVATSVVSITGAIVAAAAAGFVGFAPKTAFTSGQSGWFMISGAPIINAISAGITVPLYTSDTAGALSGTTASASHYQVMGVGLVVTASGSTASATQAVASHPMLRRPVA